MQWVKSGVAGCCARAASGHAAAPPSIVMNSRRPNLLKCTDFPQFEDSLQGVFR
jgi:hypothetical protein